MTDILEQVQSKTFYPLILANIILSLFINYSNLRLASVDLLGAFIVVIGISIDSYDEFQTNKKLEIISTPVFYTGILIRLANLLIWTI